MVVTDMYTDEALYVLRSIYPNASRQQLLDAINYSIQKRYREQKCTLSNNYTKKSTELTLSQVIEYINKKQPICTAYGVMFKQPNADVPNPLVDLIRSFMENRDIYKKEMFKFPKGSYDFAKWNLAQLLEKRDGNSIYGCLGNATSLLYNINVAAAITAQGRSLISNATMFFEGFLSNGVKFASLEEVLHYIYKVGTEKPNRRFKDSDILDRNITVEECLMKIVWSIGDYKNGRFKWIPDFSDLDVIYNTLRGLDQEEINRIYYKNNLYEFLNNTSMTKALIYIIKSLKTPYMACAEVPDEIKVELDTLQDFLREYVYYPHIWMDRVDRCQNMIKNVCAISDTDSTIVCFDPFYRFVLDKVRYEDVPISKIELEVWNEDKSKIGIRPFIIPPEKLDYDFESDEIIYTREKINPYIFLPQDNLRYSIINIIAYISGNLCNEYNIEFTKHSGSFKPDKKCLLYLKNEFLFKRGLLTDGKKNYATNQEVQEGNIIPKGIKTQLDIKGLPINKSTLKPAVKSELQKILFEEILDKETIDQVEIIKRLAIFAKQIRTSLECGNKEYYKPMVIKSVDNYDDPMRNQGIKASTIWNAVRGEELEAINLSERNTIDIVKVLITPANIESIREEFPDVYERFIELFKDQYIFAPKASGIKYEVTSLAIPIDVETPVWVMRFIDYDSIINDCLCNFPTDSVNIVSLDNDNVNYSNIMKI